jgi:hypothetical protein
MVSLNYKAYLTNIGLHALLLFPCQIMEIPDSDGHKVWRVKVYRFGKLIKTKYYAAQSYVFDDNYL